MGKIKGNYRENWKSWRTADRLEIKTIRDLYIRERDKNKGKTRLKGMDFGERNS